MAVGTVVMCVIFAATSGVVGATETVVGLLAIPPMLRYGYNKGLISGDDLRRRLARHHHPAVGAGRRHRPGRASLTVGNILLGMFIPGFMLAGAYIIYIVIRVHHPPAGRPAHPAGARRADARREAGADAPRCWCRRSSSSSPCWAR